MIDYANVGVIIKKVKFFGPVCGRVVAMRNPFLIFFAVTFLTAVTSSEAREVSSEEQLERARQHIDEFDRSLSLQERKILKHTPSDKKNDLSPSLRKSYEERELLRGDLVFWQSVVALKKDLLDLSTAAPAESEAIATTVIRSFEELRGKYRMIRPAILHNIFVNAGIKKEGFCWHWARDLMRRLLKLNLKEYDLLWATAREGTFREHNTLVITARGKGLMEGLMLDGWRHAGKPYWDKVSHDDHPWKLGQYSGLLDDEGDLQ